MTDFHPLRSLQEHQKQGEWEELNRRAIQKAKEIPCADMPNLDHVTMADYQTVYEPSDDTYLLLDGLQAEANDGQFSCQANPTILEIGCGTGVASTFLASHLCKNATIKSNLINNNNDNQLPKHPTDNMHPLVLVTDINPNALRIAQATALANSGVPSGASTTTTTTTTDANTSSSSTPKFHWEAMRCDLASALLPRWSHAMDVVIFNPPYVPTPNDEVGGCGIEASWAGGDKGRLVIDKFLPQLPQLLSKPHGVAYLITVDDNDPEDMANILSSLQLHMRPLVRRRAHNEYLTVQKITWTAEEKTATSES